VWPPSFAINVSVFLLYCVFDLTDFKKKFHNFKDVGLHLIGRSAFNARLKFEQIELAVGH